MKYVKSNTDILLQISSKYTLRKMLLENKEPNAIKTSTRMLGSSQIIPISDTDKTATYTSLLYTLQKQRIDYFLLANQNIISSTTH